MIVRTSLGVIVVGSLLAVLAILVPNGTADALSRETSIGERFSEHQSRTTERNSVFGLVEKHRELICKHFKSPIFDRLPSYCQMEDDEPEPEPEPEAPTLSFTASPLIIDEGATSTLMWDSENADECEASDGWDGMKDVDGEMVVSPATTTTYTLTCSGEGGEVEESVTYRS